MSSALGASQSLQFLPSGAMVDFAGTVAPAGWLMCDGSAVSRTVYASLFAAVGSSYGAGDGSTTFNLPDFRGRFARYNDNMGTPAGAAGRDTGRAHGSSQADDVKVHNHSMPGSGRISIDGTTTSQAANYYTMRGGASGYSWVDTTLAVSNTGSETRPINLSCNRIIKY